MAITIGENINSVTYPSFTYYLDIENKRIIKKCDGKEAIKQAIFKILQTERYSHLIYNWNYGVELENLIGKDSLFVLAELERRIKESILIDDRIIAITDFKTDISESNYIVSFTANTNAGNISIEGVLISV